jgi:hypothetical protein
MRLNLKSATERPICAIQVMWVMAVVVNVSARIWRGWARAREEQRSSVVRTSLFPPEMGGSWEGLWEALVRAGFRVEDLRSPSFALVHDT